jgi:hypothetical protein
MSEKEENSIGNVSFGDDGTGPKASSSSSPFTESLYFSDSFDEAAITAFVKSVERLVRSSHEYSNYLSLIKANYANMNSDDIQSGISSADATIEFHHYPFSLYDIIDTIVSFHLARGERFDSYSVAEETMKEHYANHIGLVPLSKTNHELAHDGHLFISKDQVFGDYPEFAKKYADGVSADMTQKLSELDKESKKGRPSDAMGVLNVL